MKPQKCQEAWNLEYAAGMLTMRGLWDDGFRPRSNKYRLAVKEWKYYKRFYSVTLPLTPEEYEELKGCEGDVQREEEEKEERAEYERYLYLQEKYGG